MKLRSDPFSGIVIFAGKFWKILKGFDLKQGTALGQCCGVSRAGEKSRNEGKFLNGISDSRS